MSPHALVPYIEIDKIELFGPFAIQPFGLLVAIGIMLGFHLTRKRAVEDGYSDERMASAAWRAVVVGLIASHILDVIFYYPERIIEEGPITLLKLWEGLSSFGGFIGAVGALIVFYWRKWSEFLRVSDYLIQGLVVGWIFGRLGCSIVHDHPGVASDFFLAVDFPGGPHHDLGLYEFLYTVFVLFPITRIMYARQRAGHRWARGAYLVAITIAYAPARFFFDFLRTADALYLGLTPGQYASAALFVFSIALATRMRSRDEPPAASTPVTPKAGAG